MPNKNTGPIRMTAAGDVYTDPARIFKIIWVGTTTGADIAQITDPENDAILWRAQTHVTNTYIPESFDRGLHAPNGFKLHSISAGVVYVYLNEN